MMLTSYLHIARKRIRAHWQSFAMAAFFGILFVVQVSMYGWYPFLHLMLNCNPKTYNCTIDSRTFYMWFDFMFFLVMATAFVTMVVTEWQYERKAERRQKERWR